MNHKVTIIGSGSVGATIAYTMAVNGIASEICLIDINTEKSLGEALDIKQGTPFCPPVKIYAGTYEDAKDSSVVIITCGVARKPGQSRLDLAQTNVNIMKKVIPAITAAAPDAIYEIVANPVDVLTYQFYKSSNIPANHIIGNGTLLDTARLRTRLAEYYKINDQNVHAFVFGEHGDSSFVPWSICNISNAHVDDYEKYLTQKDATIPALVHEDVEDYIRKSGGKIIARKGATFFAVAVSVCHVVKCIFSSTESSLSVSTMMNGEYGLHDVCLSMLTVVGNSGVKSHIEVPLTPEEMEKLNASAQKLKDTIAQINF